MSSRTIKRLLTTLSALCLTGFGLAAYAEDGPPVPGMVEGYLCNYNAGKDRDDLLAARDNLLKVANKEGVELVPSFVWHLYKGDMPVDFIWLSYHESPLAFGEAADAQRGNNAFQGALARFQTIADCTAGLGLARTVVELGLEITPPSWVVSNGCSFKKGVSDGDLGDLAGHIRDVYGSLPKWKGVPFFSIQPIASLNSPDRVLFTVHESAAAWADRMGEMVNSEAGQGLGRHFNKLMSCNATFWWGENVIAP